MSRFQRIATAATMVVVLLAGIGHADVANAGCLIENEQCTRCAQNAMREAILQLDLHKFRLSVLMFADCSIDLFHCIWRGQHHSYPCAA